VSNRFLHKSIKAFQGDNVSGTGTENKEEPAAEDKENNKKEITIIAEI
jgi:hypothetical protein